MIGWPGSWPTEEESQLLDFTLDGDFTLFDRSHEAIVGLSYSRGQATQFTRPVPEGAPATGPLPAFPYPGDATVEPIWEPTIVDSTMNQRLKRIYGATRLSVSDRFTTILGFNWSEYHRDGLMSGGGRFDQTERELSPYAGVTFAITDHLLAYASYSDIYQPQDQYDINNVYLDPSKGVNYEVGLKADWLDKRLLTTLALFTAEQQGLATFAGATEGGQYYYTGQDVESEGVELEVTGRVNDYMNVVFGFTALKLEDDQSVDTYTWVPRRTVNLVVSSRLPGLTALELGLSGKWQSDIWTIDSSYGGLIRQDSYSTLNAFASWDITEQANVRVNANNITDEKYITSLYQVAFYGAPANYTVAFGYRF
jgi:outer membrane receptor for ferric coprogen and ferric-rhodotorulic acid